jgi:uncharacterized protein YhaN
LFILSGMYVQAKPELAFTCRPKQAFILTEIRTLVDSENNLLDDDVLKKFCLFLGEESFCKMFGLNHDYLVQGGKNILESGGDAGQSVFEAGSGALGLHNLLQDLKKRSDELFTPKATKLVINSHIAKYKELKKDVKSLTLKGDEWHKYKNEYDFIENSILQLNEEIRGARFEYERLVRIKQNLPSISRRTNLLDEFKLLALVPDLPSNSRELREKVQCAKDDAESALSNALIRQQRFQQELDSLCIHQDVLQHAEVITSLYESLKSFQNDGDQLILQQKEHQELSDNSSLQLNLTRLNISAMEAEKIRPIIESGKVTLLITQEKRLSDEKSGIQENISTLEKNVEILSRSFKSNIKVIDVSHLESAYNIVHSKSDIENELNRISEEVSNEEIQIRIDLSSNLQWSESIDKFTKIIALDKILVEEYESKFNETCQDIKDINSKLNENKDEVYKASGELDRLLLSAAIPKKSDLIGARKRRDSGWSYIEKIYVNKTHHDNDLENPFESTSLSAAFKLSIDDVDKLSDVMLVNSEIVAKHEMQNFVVGNLKNKGNELREKLSTLLANKQVIDNEWQSICRPLKLESLSPKSMLNWLQSREKMLYRIKNTNDKKSQINLYKKTIADFRKDLSLALESVNRPVALPDESLAMILSRCIMIKTEIEQRNDCVNKIQEIQDEISIHTNKLNSAIFQYEKWKKDWNELLSKLHFKPNDSISLVEDCLYYLAEYYKCLDVIHTNEKFQSELKIRVKNIENIVNNLLTALNIDPEQKPINSLIHDIYSKYQKSLIDKSQQLHLVAQLKDVCDEIKLTHEKLKKLDGDIHKLCDQAICEYDQVSILPAIEDKSLRKQELIKEIKQIEHQLIEHNSKILKDILDEVVNESFDHLPGKIQMQLDGMTELDNKKAEYAKKMGILQQQLSLMDGDGKAAEKEETAQAVIVKIRDHVDEYVRLQLGIKLLNKTIDDYREKNQTPILKQASIIFSELTLHAFNGLRVDYNDQDKMVLMGVRNNNDAIPATAMSTGTRDQLFLALRLSAITHQLQANEPVPVILDDILIEFDDERAKATLKILGELSVKTQILFFTHHEHLVDLAKAVMPSSILKIHQLNRCFS